MVELYELACETNLMLASANSPREIYASAQLAAREMFAPLDGIEGFPVRPALVRSADDRVAPARARTGAPKLEEGRAGTAAPDAWRPRAQPKGTGAGGAWAGTRVLEFGSGAAGPIATRYFVEHGATVVKVESRSRPDFLRVYALGPGNPHGLEGSPLFNALNVGKRSITLDLKNPEGVALAKRLMHWADGVLENFAPRAMRGFGLEYERVAAEKPDLVMVSSCLNGGTGPHRNYPGFGSQGSALSGFNFLTGWPDREPVGPFGTITDSLSPRFGAAALAAGLLYRRRTGRGVHIDLSQVESGLYSLAPWLLDFANNDVAAMRMGNRSLRAVPHGAFPCRGEDRWVAIAAWDDAAFERLAASIGLEASGLGTLEARLARVDEIEAAVSAWTRDREALEVADRLQAEGIEAVPVADFGDLNDDPQLAARNHFVHLEHPVLGDSIYERNGFRLSDAPSGYTEPTATLGEHTERVLSDLLELPAGERARLEKVGALDPQAGA